MSQKPFWGKNLQNKVNLEPLDFHDPDELWAVKIPTWRKTQETLNSLPDLEKSGWPFAWFASWDLDKFQVPIAEQVREHLEVINWYYKILIDENKNLLEIGKVKIEIKEITFPPKILISISSPKGEFNPLEVTHTEVGETIHLIYTEKPRKTRLLGDIILHPFRTKISLKNWETETPHTPWDLLE
jgi:hypothetical protein